MTDLLLVGSEGGYLYAFDLRSNSQVLRNASPAPRTHADIRTCVQTQSIGV